MAWLGQNPTSGTAFSSGRPYTRADETTTRSFLQRVYLFMSIGLATTGLVALAVVSSPAALSFIFGNPLVFYGLMIAELLLVMAFAPVAARVSAGAASAM